MAVQKTIDNLKDGPKEDKVAVAGGIAVAVVVVLFAAWAIFFFRGIASTVNQAPQQATQDTSSTSDQSPAPDSGN